MHAHLLVSGCIKEIRDILALCWCPGVFFFFLVLSARGKTTAKPQPLPPVEQGAECTHQPLWKSAFSRILPESVTQRNPLQASAACWMLCRQLTDTVQGTPARRLFKRAGDSNLDTGQAEGPDCSSTAWAESHNGTSHSSPTRVHATDSVRLEDSCQEADLLTKTPGGH